MCRIKKKKKTIVRKCSLRFLKSNIKLIKLTFSSELTSAIFGGVGGGLFLISSTTSATHMKHGQFMEDCVRLSSSQRYQTGAINTFIFEIFVSNSFSVGEDSLCSSMYE